MKPFNLTSLYHERLPFCGCPAGQVAKPPMTAKGIHYCMTASCPNFGQYYCEDCSTEEKHNHLGKYVFKLINEVDHDWD